MLMSLGQTPSLTPGEPNNLSLLGRDYTLMVLVLGCTLQDSRILHAIGANAPQLSSKTRSGHPDRLSSK